MIFCSINQFFLFEELLEEYGSKNGVALIMSILNVLASIS